VKDYVISLGTVDIDEHTHTPWLPSFILVWSRAL